jgi:hypothetical protein
MSGDHGLLYGRSDVLSRGLPRRERPTAEDEIWAAKRILRTKSISEKSLNNSLESCGRSRRGCRTRRIARSSVEIC